MNGLIWRKVKGLVFLDFKITKALSILGVEKDRLREENWKLESVFFIRWHFIYKNKRKMNEFSVKQDYLLRISNEFEVIDSKAKSVLRERNEVMKTTYERRKEVYNDVLGKRKARRFVASIEEEEKKLVYYEEVLDSL